MDSLEGAWLAWSEEYATLDLGRGCESLSSMLGAEIT